MMGLQIISGANTSTPAPIQVSGFQLAADLGPTRDRQIVTAVLGGGARVWPWVQIPLEGGRGYFEAASDYLALGNESNWTRVPVGGPSAQTIAEYFDACLPCAFMVDLIWKAAQVKLTPQPFQDLTGMTTTRRFAQHNELIEKQRNGRNGLIAGCKKDVVVSNRLLTYPQAVCIYGWHQRDGKPIQPLSTAHREWWYNDYSHGIRLIKRQMVLDGQTIDVETVMRDPTNSKVLTGGIDYAARTRQNDAVLQVTRYNKTLLGSEIPTTSTPAPAPQQASLAPQTIAPQPGQTDDSARAPDPATANSDLGARALEWCLNELQSGVKEEPPGSNAGPRIAEYFRPARRRANGQLIGISSGDWCAVGQSAAMAAAARPGEPMPHGYRAAVWEIREDANESGAWVPVEDLRSGRYQLQRGDLLIWSRGQPGSKLGHVSRVDVPPASNGDVVTVGGNENNAWTRRTRNLSETELEGAIKYRDYKRIDFDEGRSTSVPAQKTNIVQPGQPVPRAPAQSSSVSSPDEPIDRILTVDGWMRFEEDYLPRVVTGENGHAHPEALKAQAVASRTYVLRAMRDDRSIGRTVPVPNSQKFQVYSKGAFPQCIAAVEATRGEAARYEGRLIIANYVAGSLWTNGRPGNDPTKTEHWVTYNEGRTGKTVLPTKLSDARRPDNRGCMSQNGADALARAGRNYKDILRFFYGADLEIGSETKQPTKEGAVIMPAPQVQNVMPRRPATQNAFVNVMIPRNGVEALAASADPRITRAVMRPNIPVRTNVAGTPRVAVGNDPLQTELEACRSEMQAINTRMQDFGEPYKSKWEDYLYSWNKFFIRNYYDTPLRQADAMQIVAQYRDGVKDWNNVLDVRSNQKHSTVEGTTHPDGFPVLPTLGLVAVIGAAAVMLSMAAK